MFERLDENRGRPLIWLDSPPGSGKTALVASYLESRRIPTLWYQVDAGDVDPANIFYYLSLAAAVFARKKATALPRLAGEHGNNLRAFATLYFRRLFESLPEGVVLVFDNYQDVDLGAALHDVLRTAVSQVPPGSSILCISRLEAPTHYVELLGRGEVVTLRWETLKLTLEETRQVAAAKGLKEEWLVQAIHKQSDGWAAGITLMLERLLNHRGASSPMPGDSRESIFNYFAHLILNHLSEASQRSLLSLAYLPYMSEEVAIVVSGDASTVPLLERLHRQQLFTDLRPGTIDSYQFHALFHDFLKSRARVVFGEMGSVQLMTQSAQAMQAVGDLEGAIGLRLAAREWSEAAQSIVSVAPLLLKSGRRTTLLQWISVLPPEVSSSIPIVAYWQGAAEVQTDPQRGIESLDRARKLFSRSGDSRGKLICLTALLSAAWAGHYGLDRMDSWLDELLAQVRDVDLIDPDIELSLKVLGVLSSTLPYIRPWHPWMQSIGLKVATLMTRAEDPDTVLSAGSSALACATLTCDFDLADQLIALGESPRHDPSASPSVQIWWDFQCGYLRFMQTRYDEALYMIARSLGVIEANGMMSSFVTVLMYRFMVEFRVSGWTVALATLKQAEQMMGKPYPMSIALLNTYKARYAEVLDLREEVGRMADISNEAIEKTRSPYMRLIFGAINGEQLIFSGNLGKAERLLAQSEAIVQRTSLFDWCRAGLVLVNAYLHHARRDEERALALLREGLQLAKQGRQFYFLRLLECVMRELFPLALRADIESDFVKHLIRLFRLKPRPDAPDEWPWPVRIRTLGAFEVWLDDVLLVFPRKTPKKTLALLKALIAHGGIEAPELWLCDALWADDEADAAREALGITVLRLRKLLGNNETIIQQGGRVALNRAVVWVDAWRFDALAGQEERAGVVSALALYGGRFLPDNEGDSWSVAARERLRGKFIHILASEGRVLEDSGDMGRAITWYFRGIDADPIVEAFHQGLMRCYQREGRHTEAISAYRRLRQTLSAVLGVSPSVDSRNLYEASMRICRENGATPSGEVISLAQRKRS